MTKLLGMAGMVFALLGLAGCSTQSAPITHQPMSVRPQPAPMAMPADGSIFQVSNYKPFFEDQTPVRVGDLLTVQIRESTTSSNKEDSAGQRNSKIDGSIAANLSLPFFPGALEKKLGGTSLSGSGTASEQGKTSSNNSSSFNSSITVTVIDVYPNGNLLVSGEKQMKINSEHEFIRLSGVVNPRDIKQGNTVESTRIADARIEQLNEGRGRAYNDTAWLQKIFLSVLPF
ncbi:flagellar basal body L-ring protein FlgH [Vogesella sp. XCS3]|uniref:flagellar basal body L-ring protein FlgH n=1 Tax=Vogesella sp. XCS3 TaxID=2877939 RepID=UPI001B62899A|nr:flagellar basal body L-ring protein FlgH [Vogesella sp. XCS3]MBP7579565.1 flagellar basal body L-ring protein FlgH [Vogesella sp.]UDM18178.1 flagellar basal body L-ring protein FlgH [Vogesella sp. XCS3]